MGARMKSFDKTFKFTRHGSPAAEFFTATRGRKDPLELCPYGLYRVVGSLRGINTLYLRVSTTVPTDDPAVQFWPVRIYSGPEYRRSVTKGLTWSNGIRRMSRDGRARRVFLYSTEQYLVSLLGKFPIGTSTIIWVGAWTEED